MFEFVKQQYILGRFTVEQVEKCVLKKYITEEEKLIILSLI